MMWVALSAIWIAGYLSFRKVQLWLSGRAWRRFSFGNYILPDKPIISEKIKLLILAMLKFLSYNLQFACLLLLWSDVALDLSLFISVVAMYIIGALVPTIPLTDFLVKAGVAFLVFDHAIISDSMLLNAALVTWFFNIALPSIAGGIIILRTNLLDALRKRPLPGNRYAP